MARILHRKALEDILVGSTFLGGGGGGSAEQGRYLIERIEKEIGNVTVSMVDASEMEQQSYAAMVAGIGAPRVIKERGFGPEALHAFDLLRNLCSIGGKTIRYLMAGEIGGFNTLVPIYVAALKQLPIVDADGNGRAVPELSTTLYHCYNIPVSPLVLANSVGDAGVFYLHDPLDYLTAEQVARSTTTSWGMSAAFATWIVDKDQLSNYLVTGSISLAERIGGIFRNLDSWTPAELSRELHMFGIVELFIGQITSLKTVSQSGFDIGLTVVEGIENYKGSEMTIYFKNENILAKIDETIVAMVPDIIALVSLEESQPVTNADINTGERVIVYGLRSHEKWFKTEKGFQCWKHILKAIGYSGYHVELSKR